jgi:hypothetical protein
LGADGDADRLRDLVVVAENQPGLLQRVTHTLGHARINIEGLSALTGKGRAVIHLLVAEEARALAALAAAGFEAKASRRTMVCNVADRPDAIGQLLAVLTREGVDIQHAYLAVGSRAHTRLVLVVDDLDRARAGLSSVDSW